MKDVFFYEAFEEESQCLKDNLPSGISAGFTDKTIQEYGETEPAGKIISIRTQSIIPLPWGEQIQGILSRSTGYDHLKAYREKLGADLPCGHLPLYCARAVAEQAMLLWTGLLRKLPLQQAQFTNFARDGLTGSELIQKELLVVGVGNIGHEIVDIGNALRMKVKGIDIVEKHSDVQYVNIDQGLKNADIVVCSMNLTSTNKEYFNYEAFNNNCKSSLIFINIARGEFSPAPDLLRLLEERKIAGVGLDVYNNETILAPNARAESENADAESIAIYQLNKRMDTILTPHNAFNTKESVKRKSEQSIEQVKAFIETGVFKWAIPQG